MQPNGLILWIIGLGTIEGKGIHFPQRAFFCVQFFFLI